MCAPLRIHDGADPHEGLWVGESSGRWHGNKVYAGALVAGQYLSVGCDVFLKAQPGQLQYVARIMRMFERQEDGSKMVTCKWFYRANETVLARDKKQLAQVSGQELFMSDVMDDNALSAIQGICSMRAEMLVDDLDHWLQSPQRLVYQSKYVPTEGLFKQLTAAEECEAKTAFAAAARSERLTLAYKRTGNLQCASLEHPDADLSPPALLRVQLRLKDGRAEVQGSEHVYHTLRMQAAVSTEWQTILRGTIYQRLASLNASLNASGPSSTENQVGSAVVAPDTSAAGKKLSTAGGAVRGGRGSGSKSQKSAAHDDAIQHDAGISVIQEHKRIQWIGEALHHPPAMPTNTAHVQQVAPKKVAGRRYYGKVLLANGSEVRIGSAVLLQAPEGEDAFLAQVEQLWENDSDSYKMMKCRWFYRAAEVRLLKLAKVATSLPPVHGDMEDREVMCGDDIDDNYLTTIERPCSVMHLDAVPRDIREEWLKGADNFFFRSKYSAHNKSIKPLPCPPTLNISQPLPNGDCPPTLCAPSPSPTTLPHNVAAGESEAERGRKRQRELDDTLHNQSVSLSKRRHPDALAAGQRQDDPGNKGQDEKAFGHQHPGGQQHSSSPRPVGATSHLPAPAHKVKQESIKHETGVKQEAVRQEANCVKQEAMQHHTQVKQENVKHEKMKLLQDTRVNTAVKAVACQQTLVKAEQSTLSGSVSGQVKCGSVSGQVEQAVAQCVKGMVATVLNNLDAK
mmetsp:Transcript_88270/g.129061  ORF Transcript_88270/g.129061 Transcript_88270/m.129061 type:complete len:737 (-) Transcript_88270:458-2668(-)